MLLAAINGDDGGVTKGASRVATAISLIPIHCIIIVFNWYEGAVMVFAFNTKVRHLQPLGYCSSIASPCPSV